MTNATHTNVASIILSQLGGNRFLAMTGAKDLLDLGNGLRCRIGRNAKRITHVEIILDASDTYTVNFYRVTKRGLDVELVESLDMVYADNLRSHFEISTGLYTSL